MTWFQSNFAALFSASVVLTGVPVAGLDGAAAAALGGSIAWNLALLWFVH